nr:MAG TPA: hypothetical protein [Siphoviridae sp. cthBp9]
MNIPSIMLWIKKDATVYYWELNRAGTDRIR